MGEDGEEATGELLRATPNSLIMSAMSSKHSAALLIWSVISSALSGNSSNFDRLNFS